MHFLGEDKLEVEPQAGVHRWPHPGGCLHGRTMGMCAMGSSQFLGLHHASHVGCEPIH